MPYKDPEKQKEAVRLAVRRHRSRNVIPCNNVIPDVIPSKVKFKPRVEPEPQSQFPMMVGYVPPTD